MSVVVKVIKKILRLLSKKNVCMNLILSFLSLYYIKKKHDKYLLIAVLWSQYTLLLRELDGNGQERHLFVWHQELWSQRLGLCQPSH